MGTTQTAPKDPFTFGGLTRHCLFLVPSDSEWYPVLYWKGEDDRAYRVRSVTSPHGGGGRIDIEHTPRLLYENDPVAPFVLAGSYETFQDVPGSKKVSFVNIL